MSTEHDGNEQGPRAQDPPPGEDLRDMALEKMVEALAAALKRVDPRLVGFKPGDDALDVTVRPEGPGDDPVTLQLRVLSVAFVPPGTMERRRRRWKLNREEWRLP